MCELFGVSSARKIRVNELLRVFFSHGVDHPNGWGMAFFYGNTVSLEKQPENSCKSLYLKQRIRAEIEADNMIAHIRLATRGTMVYENTHPFVLRDNRDRAWTLAHNGTIFECDSLNPFLRGQKGETDSERILLFLISKVNEAQDRLGRPLSQEERFRVADEVVCEVSPENKVNLVMYDGELLYAHMNYKDSLFRCRKGQAAVISTQPLDRDDWESLPLCRLVAYRDGEEAYVGECHGNEFFDSEEKTRLLFLDFAGL